MKDPSKSLTRIPCSVREGQCVFTIAHRLIILTMRYNSDKHYTKQHIMLCCIHCLVNLWHLKIMWKKTVQPDRPQMTKWRSRISCRVLKVTNTHSQYVILTTFALQQWFHECYIIRTLLVLVIRIDRSVRYYTNSLHNFLGYHFHVLNSSIRRLKSNIF
jgi:hypothetical protein